MVLFTGNALEVEDSPGMVCICICHTLPAGERNQITCDQMHRDTEAEVARDSGHMMAWFISQLAEDGDVKIPHRKITPFLPCPTQAMTMEWIHV